MTFILAENGFQGFIARAEDVSGEKGPLAEFEVLGLQAVDSTRSSSTLRDGEPAWNSDRSSLRDGEPVWNSYTVHYAHDGKAVMADFTPTQGRYLAFIHAYTNLHGYAPAETEIATAMCVSPPSVNQMVKMLEKKGLIDRQPGQPRSIQVRVPDDEIPPWNARKQAKSPALSSQPTEPRCSGPGGASGELVRRIGLLAEWTYQ